MLTVPTATEESLLESEDKPTSPFTGGVRGVLEDVEYTTGMVLIAFLSFGFIVIGGNAWIYAVTGTTRWRSEELRWTFAVTYPIASVMLGWMTVYVATGLERSRRPRPVDLAMCLRRGPVLLRPILAIWWIAVALALMVLVESLTDHFLQGLGRHGREVEGWAKTLYPLLLLLACANAVHICVLFAVSTVWRSEWLLRRLQAIRLVTDLALVIATWQLPAVPLGI